MGVVGATAAYRQRRALARAPLTAYRATAACDARRAQLFTAHAKLTQLTNHCTDNFASLRVISTWENPLCLLLASTRHHSLVMYLDGRLSTNIGISSLVSSLKHGGHFGTLPQHFAFTVHTFHYASAYVHGDACCTFLVFEHWHLNLAFGPHSLLIDSPFRTSRIAISLPAFYL